MNLIVHSNYRIPSWRHPLKTNRLEGGGVRDHEVPVPTDHNQPPRETTRRSNGMAFAKSNTSFLVQEVASQDLPQQKVSFCQPPNTQQPVDRWGGFLVGAIQEDSSIKKHLSPDKSSLKQRDSNSLKGKTTLDLSYRLSKVHYHH